MGGEKQIKAKRFGNPSKAHTFVGTIIAVVCTVAFFYLYPIFWEHYYADFIVAARSKGIPNSLVYAIYGSIQFATLHGLGAIIFTFVHMNEFPFLE